MEDVVDPAFILAFQEDIIYASGSVFLQDNFYLRQP
jgi:hypothetical protein